ncbi:hypothetical protein ACOME3_002883 [Neoechinorhynchus agilis]
MKAHIIVKRDSDENVWRDEYLQWQPEQFDGLESIRVSRENIWTPDLTLINNADGQYDVTYASNVIIFSKGTIQWIPPTIYKYSCNLDVRYFPFDEHKCEMRFGSLTYDAKQLIFGYYNGHRLMDVSEFSKSGSWDVLACPLYIKYTHNGTRTEFISEIKPIEPPQADKYQALDLRDKREAKLRRERSFSFLSSSTTRNQTTDQTESLQKNNSGRNLKRTSSVASRLASMFHDVSEFDWLIDHFKESAKNAEIVDEWRFAAYVMDRLFLYVFLIATIVGTLSIAFIIPDLFRSVRQDEILQHISDELRKTHSENLLN